MANLLADMCGETYVFPPMPERLSYVRVPPRLRRFGTQAQDIQLDFSLTRTALITAILEACAVGDAGAPCDFRFADGLELGKRLECLLVLTLMDGPLELTLCCPNADCGKKMDMELSLEELAELQQEAEQSAEIKVAHSPCLRRPTAADISLWGGVVYHSEADAREALVRLLLLDEHHHVEAEPILSRWPELSEALAEADPLMDFAIATDCPHCGRQSQHGFDLEAYALDELTASRAGLLQQIHTLALHYHWTEEVILKLPPWRRATYLDLIRKERSHTNASEGWQI